MKSLIHPINLKTVTYDLLFLRKGLEILKETLHPRIQLLVLFPPQDESEPPGTLLSLMLLEGVQN